jgi:hypothetical protein
VQSILLAFLPVISIPPTTPSPNSLILEFVPCVNSANINSGNQIVRPSEGETITAGAPYTIKWNAPAGDKISIELEDEDGYARSYGALCDGWLINAYCGKIANGTGNNGQVRIRAFRALICFNSVPEYRRLGYLSAFQDHQICSCHTFMEHNS